MDKDKLHDKLWRDVDQVWQDVHELYGKMGPPTHYSEFFKPGGPPPTRWQTVRYHCKRPFWWLRDWLCRALGCGD